MVFSKGNINSRKIKIFNPLIAGIASGLYPTLFYFGTNYTLVNTWSHVRYFFIYFLVFPVVGFFIVHSIASWKFRKWEKYVLPFLNVFAFLFYLKLCFFTSPQKKLIVLIIFFAFAFAFYGYKYLRKVILIQFLLAFIGLITLIPMLIKEYNYSKDWMDQPDEISEVKFNKNPNIYLIQPDGYPNFSELKKGYYNIDTIIRFEHYLEDQGFTNYEDFRSNYVTTLTSNSATFNMKHHYYAKSKNYGEMLNARNMIVSENSVLSILKNNDYRTHLILEKPYLLVNRPEMGFDYCNYSYEELDYMATGLSNTKDVLASLEEAMNHDNNANGFYFIEFFNPGHISNKKDASKGMALEKQEWMLSLEKANTKIKSLINLILANDPEALIMIMADHGGFVGYEYTRQIYEPQTDRDLLYSTFSSQLSIKWPSQPTFKSPPKSTVNLFRYVFSYLSGNEIYLEYLQEDDSYVIISEKGQKGIFKCINSAGNIVFEYIN